MREELVLDMNLDISKAEAKAKKLNAEFEKQKIKVEELKQRYQESSAELEEMTSYLKELEAITTKTADEEAKKQARIEAYRADMQVLIDKVAKERTEYELQTAKLYEKGVAIKENIQGHREEASEIENVSEQTKKVSNGFTKFANRLKELVKQAFIFTVISQALRKLKQQFSDFIKQDPVLNSMMTELKTNLRIIGQIFVETIKPVLQWILEKLVFITDTIVSALVKLIGKSVKEMKALAKATKEATKAFAGFDTIQIIDTSGDGSGGESMVNTVKNTLENIYAMLAIGAGLIVLGAILAFSGVNIPIGITLMALGAFMLYSVISENWDNLTPKVQAAIKLIMGIGGTLLVLIGLILAFTGHIVIGLGLIVFGAVAIWAAYKAELTDTEMNEQINQMITGILYIAGYIAVFLGVIFLFTGHLLLGLGLIVAGLVDIWETSKDLQGTELKQKIDSVLEPILKAVGYATLIIGLLATLLGNVVLGLGLIFFSMAILGYESYTMDATALGTEIATTLAPVMVGLGIVVLVVGIIACCGGDLLHGIPLVLAGAVSLGYGLGNLDWEWLGNLLGTVNEIITRWWGNMWNNLMYWLKTNMSWLFGWLGETEYKAWKMEDIAKEIAEERKVEHLQNVIAAPTVTVLDAAKTADWDTDVIDLIQSSDISETEKSELLEKVKKVKIPKYATGAVIPGGSPFLAMLGDQRRGQTNVEAPLDTIVEAFRAVQPEQKFTIEATGSMSQLIKLLNLEIKKEDRRSSIKAVKV